MQFYTVYLLIMSTTLKLHSLCQALHRPTKSSATAERQRPMQLEASDAFLGSLTDRALHVCTDHRICFTAI